MPATRRDGCRVEYRSTEIVIRGSHEEILREATRILRCFAGSATPYRMAREGQSEVVLKPA